MASKQTQKKPELDMEFMETIIAYNAMFNNSYLTSIIDIASPIFFKDLDVRTVFKVVSNFYLAHGSVPSATEVKAHLSKDSERNSFKKVLASFKTLDTKYNIDELLSNTEQFFRERAVYEAIQTTLKDYSDEDKETTTTETLDLFTKACNISLVDDLGRDYFNDIDDHIKDLNFVHQHLSTGYIWLDDMLAGGLLSDGRALYVFSGVTNSGKSIILGNLASNICQQDKTAIVISLEMSEDMYSKRLSSQMSKIPFKDLRENSPTLKEFAEAHKSENPNGRLFIKEFPPKSVTVSHIRAYIEKLIQKKGITPDVIIIDYVNLLSPTVVTGNSYTDIKAVTEQLRALSYLFGCPIVTATQLNRDAFNKVDPGLESTSESMGLSMTADAQFAIWSDENDKELGIINMGCQKNRFGKNFGRSAFRIDYDTLRIETMNEDFTSSDNVSSAESSIEKLLGGIE
jgi:replicative DNA helicase|tara:strand:+ start:3181 stop:4551 length:1371 start_codon:yes stop_codon:yes gene_type:complete